MDLTKLLDINLQISGEDDAKITEIFATLKEKYRGYHDPWGFNIDLCEKCLRLILPVYRQYFKVRVFGQEHIQDRPYIVVSNHSGQVAIDGLLIGIAFMIDVQSPRVLRAMVERFLSQLPFLGDYAAQIGAVLGDRTNCQYLIDHKESILVFPEGLKGISKNTVDYYKLQPFTQGFFRIALQNRTDILPIAVIGAEEMFPFVFHAKAFAKLLNLPAMPISANYIPLPSPIDIYIGKPFSIPKELSAEAPDKEIKEHVYKIEVQIKRLIAVGLKHQRPFFEQIRNPLKNFILKKAKPHK